MFQKQNINSPELRESSFTWFDSKPRMKGLLSFNTMKKCSKCGELKELSEFRENLNNKNHLRSNCKSCDRDSSNKYNKSKSGLVTRIYCHQIRNSKFRNHPLPCYTREQLLKFALTSLKFNELYDNWVISGYKKELTPSFDRANDYLPYSFENFNKWMPWKDNEQKGHDDIRNGINNKLSKAVIGTHKTTGEVVEFYSMSEAGRKTNARQGDICRCCQGERKSSGGYIWKYQ